MHYERLTRTGSAGEAAPRKAASAPDTPCSVEGCDRPHLARGLCRKHYQRWKKHGTTELAQVAPGGRLCSVEGCEIVGVLREELCQKHYRRLKRTGTTELAPRTGSKRDLVTGWGRSGPCWACWEIEMLWFLAERHAPPAQPFEPPRIEFPDWVVQM